MKSRSVAWLAWGLFGFGMVLTAATLVLGLSRGHSGAGLTYFPRELTWFLSLALFIPVGALISWRHPHNPVGWLILAMGLSVIVSSFTYEYAAYSLILDSGSLPGGAAMAWLSSWIWVPELGLFPFMILLFPNGRSLSRLWSWVGWLAIGWLAVFTVFALSMWPYRGARFLQNSETFGVKRMASIEEVVFALFPFVMACLVVSLISLIIRFRRSRGEERQQLKWIALVAALGATSIVVNDLILDSLRIESPVIQLVSETVAGPGTFAIVTGIAILKYRLYDIDLIINRALVYGALTATLGVAYLGCVVLLQQVLPLGQDSELAVAASTLTVAALFRPARARIQAFIDRRFYRHKYDVEQTLGDFSARLRDQIDLDTLDAELVSVVKETMQPAHASLWLRARPTP